MRRFGFDNEHGTSIGYGIRFLSFPLFQYGKEKVNDIEVSGKEGTLTERTGTYSDTIITNELEFQCGANENYEYKLDAIKRWLQQTKKVTYTDSEDRYYVVKKVDINQESRIYNVFGNISVVFTCSPSILLHDGDYELNISRGEKIYNAFSVSHPVFKIYGEGLCTLSVNGKSITANVGQNMTVNTDMMIAYREDGTMINTSVAGKYQDLYLNHGENTITYSSGFSVHLIPKWRLII